MNYLALIRQFWKCRKKVRFTSAEADLYFYLVEVCNELEWENPFPHPNVLAVASMGISEEKLADARNGLKQKGLIDFIPGEKNKKSPIYTIFYPQKTGNKVGNEQGNKVGNEQGNEQGKQPNIKDKLNQTKYSKSHSVKSAISQPKNKSEIVVSEDGLKYAEWFGQMIPASQKRTATDVRNWGKAYDDMIRIDKRDAQEIYRVTRWARQDSFWSGNFLSASKLRKTDKSGVQYYDIFLNKMKERNGQHKQQSSNGSAFQSRFDNGRRSVETLLNGAAEFSRELV